MLVNPNWWIWCNCKMFFGSSSYSFFPSKQNSHFLEFSSAVRWELRKPLPLKASMGYRKPVGCRDSILFICCFLLFVAFCWTVLAFACSLATTRDCSCFCEGLWSFWKTANWNRWSPLCYQARNDSLLSLRPAWVVFKSHARPLGRIGRGL